MRQILITKGTIDYALSTATGDIGGLWAVDLLTDGALAVIEQDGTLVDDTNPLITNPGLYFVLGRSNGVPYTSPLVDINTLNWDKQVYTAPVARAVTIGTNVSGQTTYGLNLPSTLTIGKVASITLEDLSKPFSDNTRYLYYEQQIRAAETNTTLMTALVAKVVAGGLVTANTIETAKGYSFVAVTAGKDFTLTCGGELASADVLTYKEVLFAGTSGVTVGYVAGLTTATHLVNNVFGVGTYAEILGLEKDYSTELGNTGLQDRGVDLYSAPSRAVSGATYTKYVLTWQAPSDNPLMPKSNPVQMLVIAVPSGDTAAGKTCAALDTILASL